MKLSNHKHCVAIVATTLLAASVTSSPAAAVTTVDVWRGGDDGLTIKFSQALEAAFRQSPEFSLSPPGIAGTMKVYIASNLGWQKVGDKMRVAYDIQFSDKADGALGTSKGSCWEDALAECTQQVLSDAKIASTKIH